jgi:protein O-mannosyl-transferase
MRLAVLPFGQSLDHDFAPSHTIMEHGAIFYMIVLAALVVAAVVWRRRYPLFCFGLLVFLICLAPTSSIVPLEDPLVERRMYLALLGLILMGCEAGGRLHVSRTAWVGILALLGLVLCKLCYDRNQLWGEPNQLIEMAADNASNNPRPLLNYTDILIRTKHCELAPAYLERAERRLPNNYYVNAAWGKALACLGRYDEAIARLQTAARIQPCSQVYEWLGLVYSKVGVMDKAGEALKKAVQLGPTSESAHGSLALWFEKVKDFPAAEQEYRTALSLNRRDTWAQARLLRVQAMTAGH